MKSIYQVLTVLIISALMTGLAYSQQATPEEKAFKFRDGLFETYGWKLGQLYAAQAKEDAAAFKKHAKDLSYLSGLLEEGFQIENSMPDGSRAKAEIWQDYESFKEKAATLSKAAAALTEDGAMKSFNIRDFGSKNCGGCHRDFRLKKEK